MGFFAFILFWIFFAIIYKCLSGGQSSGYQTNYHSHYSPQYMTDDDEDFKEDFDDYSDSETRAARGERDYFSDDPAEDYNSYYAQVADDAMMGDQESMDEINGEFGNGEW